MPDDASDDRLIWLAQVLSAQRATVLEAWLTAAAQQPFHRGQRASAIADHIPALIDALALAMHAHGAPLWPPSIGSFATPAVREAAAAHARHRAQQGLQPPDVVVEFRLLRQEIIRALHACLSETIQNRDLLAAHLLVNDALDEVITIGLSAMIEYAAGVREDFLATTVHEVRHPVTAIKMGAQLCDRYLASPNPDLQGARAQLIRLAQAADRMEQLLSDLTDVSRVALGHLTIRPRQMELVGLVRRVVSAFGAPSTDRIRLHAPADQPVTGEWDEARLEQVVGNLLSNALKYSPVETLIEITIAWLGDEIDLQVRDQGIGLTPDEMARLFQRYARGRRARESGTRGIGLGLYLCRGLVEAHGGRIWAESEGPGQGTTVHVQLPLRAFGREE